MGDLLMFYLRLAVREAHLARVPNQLISAEDENEDSDEGADVNELCAGGNAVGAGNMMGYSGPLGAGSSFPKRKKKRTKKTSKR